MVWFGVPFLWPLISEFGNKLKIFLKVVNKVECNRRLNRFVLLLNAHFMLYPLPAGRGNVCICFRYACAPHRKQTLVVILQCNAACQRVLWPADSIAHVANINLLLCTLCSRRVVRLEIIGATSIPIFSDVLLHFFLYLWIQLKYWIEFWIWCAVRTIQLPLTMASSNAYYHDNASDECN